MFRGKNSKKNTSEEIEMKKFTPSVLSIRSIVTFETVPIHLISSANLNLNPLTITHELNKTCKKTFVNADAKNETDSSISFILNDTWIEIFSYLDIRTLTFMMVSCKKIAELANDDKTREHLYNSKQKALYQLMQSASLIHPVLSTRVLHPIPEHPFAAIDQEDQLVYNDNPPGQGFVMM